MKYIVHIFAFITGTSGGGIYWFYSKNINASSNDESIKPAQKISISDHILQTKAFEHVDNAPKQQIQKIKQKLTETSSINQSEIQELSEKLKNIEDINSEITEYNKKLMHYRKTYEDVLIKVIQNVSWAKFDGYVRWHDKDKIKYYDYYGHALYVLYDDKNLKLSDHSNFFYFQRTCVNEHTQSEKCYINLPTTIYDADHSTIFKTYKGLNLYFKNVQKIAFINTRPEDFVQNAHQELKKVIIDFKNHIDKYANSISNYCEKPYVFGYDDVQTCKNEVYEPIKNLNY